jgi:hypothetical protein
MDRKFSFWLIRAAISAAPRPRPPAACSARRHAVAFDIHGSDNFLKLMYVTPDISGLRLAVSYTPDGTRNLGDVFGDDERNEQGRIWDFAANDLRTIGEVDFGLSLGYVTGENVRNTFPSFYGDLELGATLKLGYREWTFGTSYRQTNVAGGGPVFQGFVSNVVDDTYTDVWSFGLTYENRALDGRRELHHRRGRNRIR